MNLPDGWWKEEKPLPVLRITLEDILEAIRGREEKEAKHGITGEDLAYAKVYRVALMRTKT
jgi:hypothetical protein